jgi:hypothetical protein
MASSGEQYQNRDNLFKQLGTADSVKVDDLVTADTYNETLMLEHLKKIDDQGQKLLMKCAIHMAVVGSGNKTYGSIRDGDQTIELVKIFDKYGILYNKKQNEKYDHAVLSARRLVRLFRYHIQQFIVNTGRSSYLWRKYSDGDINMVPYCFQGAEHVVETEEQMKYLYKTYKNLDDQLGTKFVIRMERVFIARRISNADHIRTLSKMYTSAAASSTIVKG